MSNEEITIGMTELADQVVTLRKRTKELERKTDKQADLNMKFLNRIQELESKICDHEWEDSFSITMTSAPVDIPGGGKAVHKQIIPIRVCTKCFHLRQKNPDEVAEMQKQMSEGIILPDDPRGNLLTTP